MRKSASPLATFESIQAFLDDSRGQIIIGEIPPIRSAVQCCLQKVRRSASRSYAAIGKPLRNCCGAWTPLSARPLQKQRRRSRDLHLRPSMGCVHALTLYMRPFVLGWKRLGYEAQFGALIVTCATTRFSVADVRLLRHWRE